MFGDSHDCKRCYSETTSVLLKKKKNHRFLMIIMLWCLHSRFVAPMLTAPVGITRPEQYFYPWKSVRTAVIVLNSCDQDGFSQAVCPKQPNRVRPSAHYSYIYLLYRPQTCSSVQKSSVCCSKVWLDPFKIHGNHSFSLSHPHTRTHTYTCRSVLYACICLWNQSAKVTIKPPTCSSCLIVRRLAQENILEGICRVNNSMQLMLQQWGGRLSTLGWARGTCFHTFVGSVSLTSFLLQTHGTVWAKSVQIRLGVD